MYFEVFLHERQDNLHNPGRDYMWVEGIGEGLYRPGWDER
jgi:hypothetical protein